MGNDTAEGFERVFALHHAALLRYVERRLPLPDAAQDVAAEVWVAAWERWGSGRMVELPWLYRVAANKVADHYRAVERGRAVALALRRSVDGLPEDALARGRADALGAALADLGEREREAIMLTYWEGLRAADVAAALGCAVPTAWAVLSRARKKLRRLLEPDAAHASPSGTLAPVAPTGSVAPAGHTASVAGVGGRAR
jgi:RNA polymerase sigma-70 factor (ECF subfamily)